ncbi:MAG: hypothetical protein ACREMQ_13820, partial [Longimicrobiales bacterium]
MFTRRAVTAITLFTLLTSAACAQSLMENGARRIHERTMIRVENNNWLDMVVYAVSSGTRVRLGSVRTGGFADFSLPHGYATGSSIQLIANPIGSNAAYSTDLLAV